MESILPGMHPNFYPNMIPFLTRHVFGLPRTLANQNIVRLKLKNFGRFCAMLAGALFLAWQAWIIAQLAFAL